MKTLSFLLSLVSLSLTVTAASAAVQNQNENVVELPAYRVTAARYTEAEKAIANSLAHLRNQARPVASVRTELPSLNLVAQQQTTAAQRERSVAVAPKHFQTRS
jgi:uncharacterized protein (DUF736 family)